ncbi:conserved hypothetical protein [Chryseobacterium sp. IT-36CA2]
MPFEKPEITLLSDNLLISNRLLNNYQKTIQPVTDLTKTNFIIS